MSGLIILPSKTTTDTIVVKFPFQDQLLFGEIISGQTVQVSDETGQDPNPSAILVGAATNDGVNAYQEVTDGMLGVIYTLVCSVAGSDDHIYAKVGKLAIVDLPEMFEGV